ncbi:uncharacterized protein LOC117334000 [Pecten maximus]|uniref:uncharacterized protein LOC117334000 n=1 Tax=Pecten maximus TaxID=6579 RepID=UPI0014584F20|nr:uncharacterized protein LOC117334000 [Pecten maximus]
MVELTVPWETRSESEHERKKYKYAELTEEPGRKGWQAWNCPVEVGCRGFPTQTCWRMLGVPDITGRQNGVKGMNEQRRGRDGEGEEDEKEEKRWRGNGTRNFEVIQSQRGL